MVISPLIAWGAGAFIGNAKFQAFDSNGDPLSGGKVYTYNCGSASPKTTYSDRALGSANANPVVLDSRGECDIYTTGCIKIILKTSADVTIWTVDNFGGVGESFIQDADGDTKVDVEESTDEDIVRIVCGGTEQIIFQDGSMVPTTNDDIIIGSEAKKIKEVKTLKVSGDAFPGFLIRPKFTYVESLDYTSGGPHELVVGDTVEGETGGGTGYIAHITLTSGTWSGEDAAGVIYLHTRNATAFQSETLKDNGNLNCASIAAASKKDSILMSPFVYHHNGTTEQLLYSDSNIPFEFANLGTSDWSYLYFDDSAIVTAATNLISATELIDAVTEPSPSEAKHGEYNGEDKCFFAVLTDGADNILEFFHDGLDYVGYADEIAESTNVDPDTTWTDETLILPSFCISAIVVFYHDFGDQSTWLRYRTNGQTGTTGRRIVGANATTDPTSAIVKVITDTSQKIEIKMDDAGTNTCDMWTQGWFFPNGM